MDGLPTTQIYWRVSIKNNQNGWLTVTFTQQAGFLIYSKMDIFPNFLGFYAKNMTGHAVSKFNNRLFAKINAPYVILCFHPGSCVHIIHFIITNWE